MAANELSSAYTPLEKPMRITEQHWREGIVPLVSFSCITYNHVNFIRDTIEGFLMQETTFPVEILIHDDASTDGTAEIVREYELKYPQLITAIYQTENHYSRGIRPLQNFILPISKGKYIALCEGDDYWVSPTKTEEQVEVFRKNKNISLVSTKYLAVENEQVLYEVEQGGTNTYMFRRLDYEYPSKRQQYIFFGDSVLVNTLSHKGDIHNIPKVAAVWRKHSGGVWSTIVDNDPRLYRFRHSSTEFWMAEFYLEKHQHKRAVSHLVNSLMLLLNSFPEIKLPSMLWLLANMLLPRGVLISILKIRKNLQKKARSL